MGRQRTWYENLINQDIEDDFNLDEEIEYKEEKSEDSPAEKPENGIVKKNGQTYHTGPRDNSIHKSGYHYKQKGNYYIKDTYPTYKDYYGNEISYNNGASQVLNGIWKGNGNLKHVTGYPGLYDVTEYAPGNKIAAPHAADESRRQYMDVPSEGMHFEYANADGRKHGVIKVEEEGNDWAVGTKYEGQPFYVVSETSNAEVRRYYDENTAEYYEVEFVYGKEPFEVWREPSTKAGTRIFYEQTTGHAGIGYENTGYQPRRYSEDYSQWRGNGNQGKSHILSSQYYLKDGSYINLETPKGVWAELRREGYIKKIGDSFVLLCAKFQEKEDGSHEYVTVDEYLSQLNNKGHNATGLTDRQCAMLYISDFTYETKKKTEYNVEDVKAQALSFGGQLYAEWEFKDGSVANGGRFYTYDIPPSATTWEEDLKTADDQKAAATANELYWRQREEQALAVADVNATNAVDKVDAIMRECYNKCVEEIEKLYDKIDDGYVPTKSELLRMEQYQIMRANIVEHMDSAALQETDAVKDCLENTAGYCVNGFSSDIVNSLAATEYAGVSYSQRIWNNTEVLTEKVRESVTESVMLGKSIQEAARDLKDLTNKGRAATERIIRTETARVYAKAAEESYKASGIEEVEILVEPGACEECEALRGKTWKLGEAPALPIHPNCRCCVLPVIK